MKNVAVKLTLDFSNSINRKPKPIEPIKPIMKRLSTAFILILFVITGCGGPEPVSFEYTTGDESLFQTPVSETVTLEEIPESVCLETATREALIPAQAEQEMGSNVRIWWIGSQPSNSTETYIVRMEAECPAPEYTWERNDDNSIHLEYDGNPLIGYEHPVYDSENVELTKKPFHHVYSPMGDSTITKGPGGLYSHHRGIFYGYNRVILDDREFDFWHAENGEHTQHDRFIKEMSGPVFGGHIVEIDWKDENGEILLEEEREFRVRRYTPESFIIDFDSRLYAIAGLFSLGGDLQHAGVQFRADQYVADNQEVTRFIRPSALADLDPKTELGEENRMDLPWDAMNYTLENGEYTVVYMSHPSNPDDGEMSERLYGRFGEFIPYQLSEGAPFLLKYRFWIVEGEAPSVDEIEEMYQVFAE